MGNYVWKNRLHNNDAVIKSRKMMSVGLKQRQAKMITRPCVNPDGHYFCSRHFFLAAFLCAENRTNLSYKYRPTVDIFRLKQTHSNTKKHGRYCETRISNSCKDTNFGRWLVGAAFILTHDKTKFKYFAEQIWNKFSEWILR